MKSKFLALDYRLIETMLVQNGKILFLDEHLARLKKSSFSIRIQIR